MVPKPSGVISRPLSALRACLLFIFAVLVCCAIVLAAPAGRPAEGQARDSAASDSVGSDACATCHQEVSKEFAGNPHSKMAPSHRHIAVTCENCHGAGKAHAAGGDISKIFDPAKATAREVDARCLGCHQGQYANFQRSGHGEADVSCVGCHSVHSGTAPEHLLKTAQRALCFQCHSDIKPQFSMPFHHKVEEGLIACSDCHDPHGTLGGKGLKSAALQDAVCTRCHSETAGPFVYEHAAVKTEGCTACHFPHGGPNARLLNRAAVNTICLLCHSPSPDRPAHSQAAQQPSCISCHADIHGSNTQPHFFKSDS